MDTALTLARHFARLVWLVMRESSEVDEQKAQLRAMVTLSKEAPARLRGTEGRLLVNDVVLPGALSGVGELADQLGAYGIAALEIDQDARPSELLAVARLLAARGTSVEERTALAAKVAEWEGRTVRFERVPAAAIAEAGPSNTVDLTSIESDGRVKDAFERLLAAVEPTVAQQVLDELLFAAEQAQREGLIAHALHIGVLLLTCEARVADPEVRRFYLVAMRRLTKPAFLRPVARLIVDEPSSRAGAMRLLSRFPQDGVDASVDQLINATSGATRDLYQAVLAELPDTREALLQMLGDPRWYVVREAAQLLAELRAPDVERQIAELLSHEDDRVRRAAVRALHRFDSPFVFDALARALSDRAASVRLAATTTLSQRKSVRSAALLSAAIDDETETEVQFALLAALGRMATPDAVHKLTSAAEAASGFFKTKKIVGLRVAAVYALAEARTPTAMAAIQSLLNDKEREVRDSAKLALTAPRGTAA